MIGCALVIGSGAVARGITAFQASGAGNGFVAQTTAAPVSPPSTQATQVDPYAGAAYFPEKASK